MYADIGKFLRETRKSKNMTQLDVARRFNITPQAVSKWERGECLPDITFLPEIALMFDIKVEDILAGGVSQKSVINEIKAVLSAFVNEQLFARVLEEFKNAASVQKLNISSDIFLFLNIDQKNELLDVVLDMEGYEIIIDDIVQYINNAQRSKLIKKLIDRQDYNSLEILIPFMTRTVKTEITAYLLNAGEFDFLEDLLPFLNREQKDSIIKFIMDNNLNPLILDNFIPFFDSSQRKILENNNIVLYEEDLK